MTSRRCKELLNVMDDHWDTMSLVDAHDIIHVLAMRVRDLEHDLLDNCLPVLLKHGIVLSLTGDEEMGQATVKLAGTLHRKYGHD